MKSESAGSRPSVPACTRCGQAATVIVAGEPGSSWTGACSEHLEWVFFFGVDEWLGERRTP